jgi:hypothetical protein
MHIHISRSSSRRAYALVLTLVFLAISVLLLGAIANWTRSSATVTARNNSYHNAVSAAEAATEVVIAQMDRDFTHNVLTNNMSNYAKIVPSSFISNGWVTGFQFSDGNGHANKAGVVCTGWQVWTNLNSEFAGLYGLVNIFNVTSDAREVGGAYPVAAAVRQDFQLSTIPVFQYAIFYSMDLEIDPSPAMVISGKTHSNGGIYTSPTKSLEFLDAVSSAKGLYLQRGPNDTNFSGISPTYDGLHVAPVSSMTLQLPIGTNNDPANVVQILDQPNEDPLSDMGKQRLYNKSDLIILVSNATVTVKINTTEDGENVVKITNNVSSFINTNVTFYDYRESNYVLATEINVAALTNWMRTSGFVWDDSMHSTAGHHINSIYIDDERNVTNRLTAIRVANGRYLPPDGLSVSTPRPLYVEGNFNAPDLTPGSTNTANAQRASLMGDAVTVLSGNWSDASGTNGAGIGTRKANDTTVNAAILAGIVQSTTSGTNIYYSGGVENLPRFLEDWDKKTLTYNGSMVVMFPSRYATHRWVGGSIYYKPPNRDWAFDMNFLDPSRLPPVTPKVNKLQRGQWRVVATSGL